jgi:hypothetical protein
MASNDIFIILIGSAATNSCAAMNDRQSINTPVDTGHQLGSGQTPTAEDFINAINTAAMANFNLRLIVIDPAYHSKNNTDFLKINSYPPGYYEVVETSADKWEYLLPMSINGEETLMDIRDTQTPLIIFNYASSGSSDDALRLLGITNVSTAENVVDRFVIPGGCSASIPNLTQAVVEYINYHDHHNLPDTNMYLFKKYDMYSGDLIPPKYHQVDIISVRNYMTSISVSIKHFLLGGYGSQVVPPTFKLVPPPRWAFTNCGNDMLHRVHHPHVADLVGYATINKEYQRNLLTTLLSLVSNFVVNNQIEIGVVINDIADWYHPQIWDTIISNIGKWYPSTN